MRLAVTLVGWIVVGAVSFAALPADAQQPKASQSAGGPLANALKAYEAEEYAKAALALKRVVDGQTGATPADVQRAEFFLGKSLYHLKFHQSALTVFDQIVQAGREHAYFDETLQWLAQLASLLPESAGIIEKVGQYDVSQLKQFDTPENKELYNHILYLMGRYKYQQGEFEEAISLLSQVRRGSSWYAHAKFFEGISHVRQRRARPAIAAFRAIVDAEDEGELNAGDDEQRLLDLAWLSLARTYYKAANRTDPATGELKVDGRILGNAVEAWNRIDRGSEYWLDSIFEESWAFFLADEYSRSLGNVHTLTSPYFDDAYYPEAYVLKAVVFFYNCQMENASAMVGKFHELYDPIQGELQEVLARNEDNLQFYKFLKSVREGKANVSPRLQPVVSSALSDRELLRHLKYVEMLEEEEQRLKDMDPGFRNSELGAQILQDIALGKSFAIDQAGDLARARFDRLIAELQDLMNQIDTVDVEVLSYTRGQLSQDLQNQQLEVSRAARGDVEVDEEHQVWPFKGEYWRDELGFYRQQVTSRCGR